MIAKFGVILRTWQFWEFFRIRISLRETHRRVWIRQFLRRPVLGLLPIFVPISAFVTGPVSTALVAGRPGGLLDHGIYTFTGNLFSHERRLMWHHYSNCDQQSSRHTNWLSLEIHFHSVPLRLVCANVCVCVCISCMFHAFLALLCTVWILLMKRLLLSSSKLLKK